MSSVMHKKIVGFIANSTRLGVEALTIHEVVTYCIREHIMPLFMETSSLIIKKVTDEDFNSLWAISMEVQKIQEWKKRGNFQVSRVLREGNQLANSLTEKAFL